MKPEEFLMTTLEPTVVARHVVPPRPERCAPIPDTFAQEPMRAWIEQMTGGRNDLWFHQSKALELIARGHNTVIATTTASGKTLVFQAAIMERMRRDPHSTFIFALPQVSLACNQTKRWKAGLAAAGLPEHEVAEIHGGVPSQEREGILQRARITIATPDVIHAWFLRNLASPTVRRFIRNLSIVGIDEAHCLEGVLGSNCAYLFRRLLAARNRLRTENGMPPSELQIVAASGTIADPANHLEALTGLSFEVVSEADNGAPSHGLTLLHLEGPDRGAAGEAMLTEYVGRLAREPSSGHTMIAFQDSRQGVERTAAGIGLDDVEPYRAGLDPQDRIDIEDALDANRLSAVISTSALEVGIDIPQFTVGLNLGVPPTRKSFRQRTGRPGRNEEAAFAIIAPASAFAQYGTTLREFYEGPPEASALYLSNPMIQFQHAACLFEECGAGDELQLPPGIAWPSGFDQAFAWAKPGAVRPREIEQVAAQSTGCPHLDYTLRQRDIYQFALKEVGSGDTLGTIDIEKALRETYPGATAYQRKRPYRVTEWRQTSSERTILLQPVRGGGRTVPIITTRLSVSHQDTELQEGRLMKGLRGSLAETRLHVTESVMGYALGSKQLLYRELSQKDRRKTKKTRNFSTTGVVIRIDEPWFNGYGGSAAQTREQLAQALVTILSRERSIAPGDIRFAHSGIAMHGPAGPRMVDDAIVIYDAVAGGLRLTAPLFAELEHFIDRLRRGAELAGTEALLDEISVTRLERWLQSLQPAAAVAEPVSAAPGGEIMIYAPGSTIGVRINGQLAERQLLGHNLVDFAGGTFLGYFYHSQPGVKAIVPHDQIEVVGHDWRHVLWDPQANTVREIAA